MAATYATRDDAGRPYYVCDACGWTTYDEATIRRHVADEQPQGTPVRRGIIETAAVEPGERAVKPRGRPRPI